MSDRTVSVLRTRDDRVIPEAGVYDIESYQTITFRSTGVKALPEGAWSVDGDLTVAMSERAVA